MNKYTNKLGLLRAFLLLVIVYQLYERSTWTIAVMFGYFAACLELIIWKLYGSSENKRE